MAKIRKLADLERYDALSIPECRKTFEGVLSSDDRKRMGELRAFLGFVKASGLPIDRYSVVCLDPPYPDIRCRLSSSPYFFELKEVTDKELARRYSESLRTGRITGCWFSQEEPLKLIVRSTAQKKYETEGAAIDLLLYYWKQVPDLPVIQQTLTELKDVVVEILGSTPFSRIWLYEHPEKVLGVLRGEP